MMGSQHDCILCLIVVKLCAFILLWILLHVHVQIQVQFIHSDHTIDGIYETHIIYTMIWFERIFIVQKIQLELSTSSIT